MGGDQDAAAAEARYLANYIPLSMIERLCNGKEVEPEVVETRAAVLFADISGFTPLAERLYREHKDEGHEILTTAINEYFDWLVNLVRHWEGEVVKFVGDAVITMWSEVTDPNKPPRTMFRCAQLAANCALCMQNSKRDGPNEHGLMLKVGLGVGVIYKVVVGGNVGDLKRYEYLVSGVPLNQAFNAEGCAQKGDVILSPEIFEMLQSSGMSVKAEKVKNKDGKDDEKVHMKLKGFKEQSEVSLSDYSASVSSNITAAMLGDMRGFVPQPVLAEIDSQVGRLYEQEDWGPGELRTVSVIFIQLPTLELKFGQSNANPLMVVNLAFNAMQEIILKYGGMIRQFVIDDKGSVLICVFGCPGSAHEDDPVRAIRVAQLIQRRLIELKANPGDETPRHGGFGQMCAIGVTTGNAFCGIVGQKSKDGRREYAIVGDVVNFSARLMARAGTGVILCDERTYERAKQHIKFKTLPEISVKGKEGKFKVFQPTGKGGAEKKAVTRRISDMACMGGPIGRDEELEKVQRRVDALVAERDGQYDEMEKQGLRVGGGYIVIEGAQGIGKSRLVEELVRSASADGIPYVNVVGDAVEKSSPLFMWSSILSTMLSDVWAEAYPQQPLQALHRQRSREEMLCRSGSFGKPGAGGALKASVQHPRAKNVPRIPANPSFRGLAVNLHFDDSSDDDDSSVPSTPRDGGAGASVPAPPSGLGRLGKLGHKSKPASPAPGHGHGHGHSDDEPDSDENEGFSLSMPPPPPPMANGDDDSGDEGARVRPPPPDEDDDDSGDEGARVNAPPDGAKPRLSVKSDMVPPAPRSKVGGEDKRLSLGGRSAPATPRKSLALLMHEQQDKHRRIMSMDMEQSDLMRNGEKRLGDDVHRLAEALHDLLWKCSDSVSKEQRMTALLKLLRTFVNKANPLMLVFEDVQNMDAASISFLAKECAPLARNCLFVLTCRAEELAHPSNAALLEHVTAIKARPNTDVIPLDAMSNGAIGKLVAAELGVNDVPQSVLRAILPRAEGNPFLAKELANQLRDRGFIKVTRRVAVVDQEKEDQLSAIENELPTSVEQIFRSRIDALPANLQLSLKVASVLCAGSTMFSLRLMTLVHPQSLEMSDVGDQVEKLVENGFLQSAPSDVEAAHLKSISVLASGGDHAHEDNNDEMYMFVARVCQQVAYEMMMVKQRRLLHALIAELYEKQLEKTAKNKQSFYPSVALHHQRAQNRSEAIHYLELCADVAVDKGDNVAVVQICIDMLELQEQLVHEQSGKDKNKEFPPTRIARWHRMLAQAYASTGDYELSKHHFVESLTLINMQTKHVSGQKLKNRFRASSVSVSDLLFKKKGERQAAENSDKLLEAAWCYYGLFDLYINHLSLKEEAVFVAGRLEFIVASLNDPAWDCASKSILCVSSIVGGASREVTAAYAKQVLPFLRSPEKTEHSTLRETSLRISRALMAIAHWSDMDESLRAGTALMAKPAHMRRRMQNMYCQALYYFSLGWYKHARAELDKILQMCEGAAQVVQISIQAHCALAGVMVRLGQPDAAYDHFMVAAQQFIASGSSNVHAVETQFDIAAAGALSLSALDRVEESIHYMGICYKWCQEALDHEQLHAFRYIGLRQFSEAILNLFWVMSGDENFDARNEQEPVVHELLEDLRDAIASVRVRKPAAKPVEEPKGMPGKIRKSLSRGPAALGRNKSLPAMVRKKTLALLGRGKRTVKHIEPDELTVEAVSAWLSSVSSHAAKILMHAGAHFRIFRPVAWLTRAIPKMIRHESNAHARAIKYLNKAVMYGKKYGMCLETTQACVLAGWFLSNTASNPDAVRSEVAQYFDKAEKGLEQAQGEVYTSSQLANLREDLHAVSPRGK